MYNMENVWQIHEYCQNPYCRIRQVHITVWKAIFAIVFFTIGKFGRAALLATTCQTIQ